MARCDQTTLVRSRLTPLEPDALRRAGEALALAIESSGLTLADVARRSGIAETAIRSWREGSRSPSRKKLERVASVLQAPVLLEVFDTWPVVIRMHCLKCDTDRDYTPVQFRKLENKYRPQNADDVITVDQISGSGSYTCNPCKQRVRMKRRARKIKEGEGPTTFYDQGVSLAENNKEKPKQRKKWLEAVRSANKARQGQKDLTEHQLARQRLGNFRLDPKGRFSLCRMCHGLIFTEESHLGRAPKDGVFHRRCYQSWWASAEMGRWRNSRKVAQARGREIPPIPLPALGRGRRSTHDDLLVMYQTTVRYFRQVERSPLALRDPDFPSRPASITDLARDMNVSEPRLFGRVREFLELLERTEEVASGRVRIWCQTLLTIWRMRASVKRRTGSEVEADVISR